MSTVAKAAHVWARDEETLDAGALAIEVLSSKVWTDHAPTMHAEVMDALKSAGFHVFAECPMPYRGGRRGRIDVVAIFGRGRVGIELDCRRPRAGSIAKLRLFEGFRIIGLRGIEGYEIDGINACVPMRVHFATPEAKADRRIYRPRPEWAEDWKGAA